MKSRYFTSIALALFLSFVLSYCSHVGSPALQVNKTQNAVFSKHSKFAIGEIEGWPEAVGILKGSLTNSLLNMYTEKEEDADYIISGNIYAKRYWRTRRYVFYTINLRLADKAGNALMSFRNEEPFMQQVIDEFTLNMVKEIKAQMK